MKPKKRKISKIRKSAEGEDCQLRIPGHCISDNETTVLCHLGGGGMGAKRLDHESAYGCFGCHQVVDGHVKSEHSTLQLKAWFYDGVMRTQRILIEKGLMSA